MSRESPDGPLRTAGFPRVSGDEPVCVAAYARKDTFSPRERG